MKKLTFTMFLLSSAAFALDSELNSGNEELSKALSHPYEPNWFSMIFGLCLVVVLIYMTSYIYQRLLKVRLNSNPTGNEIEIVVSKPLGQNKHLHIVKVNDEYSLLASTQTNITYIKDIKPKEGFTNGKTDSYSE